MQRYSQNSLKHVRCRFWPKQLRALKPEAYSEPSRTSNMELLAKKVNSFHVLTIFARSSILAVCLNSECGSGTVNYFCKKVSSQIQYSLRKYKKSSILSWRNYKYKVKSIKICSQGKLLWKSFIPSGSLGFYLPCCNILQRNFPNFQTWKCLKTKSLWGLYISFYFVLMQYILVQGLMKTFSRQICFFSFSIFRWHIVFQRQAFFQINFFGVNFSDELHVTTSSKSYNLLNKRENQKLN